MLMNTCPTSCPVRTRKPWQREGKKEASEHANQQNTDEEAIAEENITPDKDENPL